MHTTSIVNPLVSLAGTINGFISARLMAAYNLDGQHVIHVSLHNRTNEGRLVWRYVLTCDDVVIFDGIDFSTGSTDTYGGAARGVLGFLTLRPGDADSEYFAGYTAEQVAWRDEHAEDLAGFSMAPGD